MDCALPSLQLRILYFFIIAPPTTQIHTLSLHDALPISHNRVVAVNRSTGSVLRGPNLTYYRAVKGVRDTLEMYATGDRKSTRLNSSHPSISYAVFCLKKKKPAGQCRAGILDDRPRLGVG